MSLVEQFQGFDQANTTAVPDVFFDELLPTLSGAECKVMLYIIRRTLGFKKTTDAISYDQFLNGITTKDERVLDKGCGVKDRTTLSKALARLEAKNCIETTKGKNAKNINEITTYSIKFRSQGSRENLPPVVGKSYQGSRENPQGVVGKSYPQLDSNTTNSLTNDTYDADASLPHIFSDDELLALLRERGYSVTNQPELSTPDTANVEKLETEPLATSNPIATDTQEAPTQNENGSHESPPQGRAQPEKKPRAPRVQKPEKVVLTPQAQAFYDLYCSMPWIKIAPEITEKVGDQCEKLGAHLTTQEQLFKLRTFMSRKPFFKGKGFTFGLLVLALNDYASEQEPIDLQKRRDEANRNTPSLPTQSDAEKEAKIQECKAALARLKEQERLSQVYPGRMGA